MPIHPYGNDCGFGRTLTGEATRAGYSAWMRLRTFLIVAASVALAAGPAWPQSNFEQPTPIGPQSTNQAAPAPGQEGGLDTWLGQREMTGNWGGLRSTLAQDGVILRSHLITESAGNPVGGVKQGGALSEELNIGADLDFAKMTGLDLGTLHVTLTQRAGSNLSARAIGNLQNVQEIYGDGQTVRVTEFVYGHDLFDDHVNVEFGRANTEEDFAASPTYWGLNIYCDFQNLSICGTPLAAPNDSGYVAYPVSTWGGRVKIYPDAAHHYHADLGVYQVDPTIVNSHNGFKFSNDDATGVIIPLEIGTSQGPEDGVHGNYSFGGWYDTSEVKQLPGQALGRFLPSGSPGLMGLPDSTRRGRDGLWFFADQVLELDAPRSKRGLVGFATLELGDKATSLLPLTATLGLVRHGTFAHRDSDTINLAFAVAEVNTRLAQYEGLLQSEGEDVARQGNEYMVELNYGVAVAPWLLLRPGMQYVWHPAGENEIPNAFVLALQTSTTF